MRVTSRGIIWGVLSVVWLSTAVVAQKPSAPAKTKSVHQLNRQPRTVGGPQRLHFCGELVPTQQGDVSAKLALALASSSGYIQHVNALKMRSAPFFSVIEPILMKYNIPQDFKYLPLIESAWQSNAVSSAGAVGYWQFMDDTAQDMGLSTTPGNDERTHLQKSTEAACKYLRFLYQKLGSWTLVAAAYNGGVGMVQRKINQTGHRDYYTMTMNAETGYYLYRILAMKELLTNPIYSNSTLLIASGNAYEREREQARRMGWLQDNDPEPVGVSVESLLEGGAGSRRETTLMDSVLTELLKQQSVSQPVFVGDAVARLVKAGPVKVGQSWAFALTESLQLGEDELQPGDLIYAVVDDVDAQGNLFLRATKAYAHHTQTLIPITLVSMNPATGLAGVPRPKVIKPGWVVQWKL